MHNLLNSPLITGIIGITSIQVIPDKIQNSVINHGIITLQTIPEAFSLRDISQVIIVISTLGIQYLQYKNKNKK